MAGKKYLSKSTFIRGLQCEKSLYLHKFKKELADSLTDQQKAIFQRGSEVGLLAQNLFPGGVDATPKNYLDYFNAINETKKFIEQGYSIIYEAGFLYSDVMCFVDILVKDGNKWHAYEVKSSTSVSETHILDASLQYFILNSCGLDMGDISIVHLDNHFVKDGDVDLNKLFNIQSVFSEVILNQNFVSDKLTDLHKVLQSSVVPAVDIGRHCSKPYDCDFKGYCWQNVPKYSVLDISRLKADEKWNLYNSGYVNLKDIPWDFNLSDNQKIEIESHINNTQIIHKKNIQKFINSLSSSVYHLDFETYQSAVPQFDGLRPYQQIPFQYSAHYETDGRIMHFEFLAQPGKDPRRSFVESLISDMKNEGDILVYNIGFERGRLLELIKMFPEYKIELESIIVRMKDLMMPFKEKWYYKPEMQGSYSIKKVLPALVPSISYDSLEINNGLLASSVFSNLHLVPEGERDVVSRNLLEYCKMDTFAMVKILEVLRSLV